MKLTTVIVSLLATVAAKDDRTFAVLHHHNKGPLVEARIDPVVHRSGISPHLHTVMGSSNFAMDANGAKLKQSKCTTANIKADLSSYWFPTVFFQDPKDGHFEKVDLYYFNVYYFFEATNDQTKAFPTGLRMLSGLPDIREAPNNRSGAVQLDPNQGPIVAAQWTCPRSTTVPPSWPADSDGSTSGIADPLNKNVGIGFPDANCDGYASPLRMDIHFPSCYNPNMDLEDYQNNVAFPTQVGSGKWDCPEGWIHMPHIFYEAYWNTPSFKDRWTTGSGKQPFILSNGDRTGFSVHADFIAAWDENILQQIIDGCNVGHNGMETCPGMSQYSNTGAEECTIPLPLDEQITGKLAKLPGDNPSVGWGVNEGRPSTNAGPGAAEPAVASYPPVASVPAEATQQSYTGPSPVPAPEQESGSCKKKRYVHNHLAQYRHRGGISHHW